MDIPNFKDVLQRLSVFKNNLSLLVPVVVGLVSLLLFIPTQLMSSKLKGRIEQDSIEKGGREVQILGESVVPREQYEKEAERQEAHANDAKEIAALAEQSTKRELLSYVIFPEPDPNGFSELIFQKFGRQFRSGIDELIARVNGRDCPTDAELDMGLKASSLRSRIGRGGFSMGASSRSERPSLYGGTMMSSVDRMIVDEMCQDRAKSISVYVNPADLSGYEYWAGYNYEGKEDAIKDCWYHQLAYWVIEDIFDTMAAMNSEHDSVLTAPVKRFLRVTFTMGLKGPRRGTSVFRGFRAKKTDKSKDEADRPSYVISAADGLAESCTGRYCGDDIDVIHFNISVVVSAKAVLPFMKELCSAKQHKFSGYPDGLEQPQIFKHNQITVLESKIGSANLNGLDHRYYRYGEDSVLELDLVCEYIFNKRSSGNGKGYEDIKPESVKKTLAGEDETE